MLTTDYAPGTPNWLDLGARDMEAAIAFYSGVFGWEFESAGPESGGYGFFRLDGRIVAAAGPLAEDADPSWTVYFHTADADATAKAVEHSGGTVRMPPVDVFTAGRTAAFTDPTGAGFAVWQPGERKGLERLMAPATLCWTELYTTDAAAARAFYRAVFAWSTAEPMGGGYTVVSPAGTDADGDAAHGGIMQLPPEVLGANAPSEWHPYFAATDVAARVEAAAARNATTLIPPTDVSGVGRLALLRDPGGAEFALIKGDPQTP